MSSDSLKQNPSTVNNPTVFLPGQPVLNIKPNDHIAFYDGHDTLCIYRVSECGRRGFTLHFITERPAHPADLWPVDEALEADLDTLEQEAFNDSRDYAPADMLAYAYA